MKRIIVGFLVLISLILVGCSNEATFGEGDTKFSVELVDGSYELNDGSGKDIAISGNLNLKLCNRGQKELPFVLTKDVGSIVPKFKPGDVDNVNQVWMQAVQVIELTSDEGFINLAPGNCPTYPFSFRKAIGTDPTGEYNGFQKSDFENAEFVFMIGDKEFKLEGKSNLFDDDKAVKASGLSESKIKSLKDGYLEEYNKWNPYCVDSFARVPVLLSQCTALVKNIAYSGVAKNEQSFCDVLESQSERDTCKDAVPKSKEQWSQELIKFLEDTQ